MGRLVQGLILFLMAIAWDVAVSFLLAWPVWMLWNACLVGAVTGVLPITWLTAWGISILCSFLFKSSKRE